MGIKTLKITLIKTIILFNNGCKDENQWKEMK